jgi:hypothetical protein
VRVNCVRRKGSWGGARRRGQRIGRVNEFPFELLGLGDFCHSVAAADTCPEEQIRIRSTGLTLSQHIAAAFADYKPELGNPLGACVLDALRARVPAEYVGAGRFPRHVITCDSPQIFADSAGPDQRGMAASPAILQMSVFFSEEGCEEAAAEAGRARIRSGPGSGGGRELERKRREKAAERKHSGASKAKDDEDEMEDDAAAASMQILAAAAAALSDGERRGSRYSSGRRGTCEDVEPSDGAAPTSSCSDESQGMSRSEVMSRSEGMSRSPLESQGMGRSEAAGARACPRLRLVALCSRRRP